MISPTESLKWAWKPTSEELESLISAADGILQDRNQAENLVVAFLQRCLVNAKFTNACCDVTQLALLTVHDGKLREHAVYLGMAFRQNDSEDVLQDLLIGVLEGRETIPLAKFVQSLVGRLKRRFIDADRRIKRDQKRSEAYLREQGRREVESTNSLDETSSREGFLSRIDSTHLTPDVLQIIDVVRSNPEAIHEESIGKRSTVTVHKMARSIAARVNRSPATIARTIAKLRGKLRRRAREPSSLKSRTTRHHHE